MIHLELTVELVVQGPLLCKSSVPGGRGLDAVMARDATDRPVIPGSHLVGKMRDTWRWLDPTNRESAWRDYLLGVRNDAGDYNPKRKAINVGDFVLTNASSRGVRHRIAIDDQRGAADTGAICFAEDLFHAGGEYVFAGQISFVAQNSGQANKVRTSIEGLLRAIPQLGGQRTVGYGRLLRVNVRENAQTYVTDGNGWADGLDLSLRPLAPFCLSRKRVADNIFESDNVVSGAVLAGALATMWRLMLKKTSQAIEINEKFDQDRPELGRHFDRIHFGFAFPAPAGGQARPVQWPLSLVQVGEETYDVTQLAGPHLIAGLAPAFAVDWKSSSDVDAAFGWAELRKELRVRTAIDPQKRRAEDEQLFAYEIIAPDDHVWLARIRFPEDIPVGERRAMSRQLAELLQHGLDGIGKTKTRFAVTAQAPGAIPDRCPGSMAPMDGQLWLLTLQTPALLCDPSGLSEDSGAAELFLAYAKAWHQLSQQSMTLMHYYARQELAGGEYLWRRFQQGGQGTPYRPWLLTCPGSVFVLRATNPAKALEKIASWRRQGLDLPSWLGPVTWRTCPFLPQLGYGEFAVNLACHGEMAPRDPQPIPLLSTKEPSHV
ncbi:MAG: hypothetical protein BWK76_09885 [Desulfobulbaceae bacterium A2]|nr:MAG: hypothetical protein BWK76_09885 [Desulfobulbaceae bacterium A2]